MLRHGEFDEGANFIQKPFSPEELAAKIREILGTPAAGRVLLAAEGERRMVLSQALEGAGYSMAEVGGNGDGQPVDLVVAMLPADPVAAAARVRDLRRMAPEAALLALAPADFGTASAAALGVQALLYEPVAAELLLAKAAEVLLLRPPGRRR
jgi:hypothetical protein